MNRFENMENFIRIVDAGSISGAAERLGVAKSAVSRRLKELEKHLAIELFHRTTRRMNLTDVGREFYQQSIRILDEVHEAELASSQTHGTLKGRLKVAMPASFGLMHMSPAINDFLSLHPQLEFDLDFNDRQVDIMQEGFDLAIRIAKLADSSFMARRLAPIKLILCASPDYIKLKGKPKTPDDLLAHQCLAYNLLADINTWPLYDAQQNLSKVKIKPYIKASSGEFLRSAAVCGKGIILIPSFIVHQEIEQGTLLPILSDYTPASLDAYAIYPQTQYLSQRVRTFVDFLVQRFGDTPYWDQCLL